jgi:glc operon protein GlcG
MKTRFLLAATLLLATVHGAAAQLADKKVLTLAGAQQIAAAAQALAVKNNFKQSIVVLDDGGNLLVFYRMDDAQLAGFQVAMAKAKTALMFQTTSKSFADRILAGQTNVLGLPGAAPIDGGVLLMHEGKIVGALGVSGASPVQDGQTATAAAATLQ